MVTIEQAPQIKAPSVESFDLGRAEIPQSEIDSKKSYTEPETITTPVVSHLEDETKTVPVEKIGISAGYELVNNNNHEGNATLINKINHVEPEVN